MAHSISGIKTAGWVFVLLYWVLATIFQGVAPSLQNFDYTYLRPVTNPGTLQSQRWSFYFWIMVLYVSIWIVPLTLAFALDDTKGRPTVASDGVGKGNSIVFWRMIFHLVLVALLLLWYMAVFIYGLTLWSNANVASANNVWNPANDPRWCCVWLNLENHDTNPSFPCINTAPCSPGVSADMLVVNPVFLYTLWFGFIFIVALLVDVLLVLCLVRPAYEAHAMGAEKRSSQQQSLKNAYLERLV